MGIVLVIIAFILLLIGIVGSVFPVVPGPPISFIGLLLVQKSGYVNFTPEFLWVWAGITIVITVMDYIFPSWLTRKFGGSRAASIGSLIGLLAGTFVCFPWGLFFGSFVGAFIGEIIHNNEDKLHALKVACGAFLAFIVGSGAKLFVTIMMFYRTVKALLA